MQRTQLIHLLQMMTVPANEAEGTLDPNDLIPLAGEDCASPEDETTPNLNMEPSPHREPPQRQLRDQRQHDYAKLHAVGTTDDKGGPWKRRRKK